VRNVVRHVFRAVSLTAILFVSHISGSVAAQVHPRTGASYPSTAGYSSQAAAPMSRAEEPVPPNCIRQSCGKLWCWQMKGGASH
jgi:hypothetical protein